MERRRVVCLSSLLWHGRPTSRHHLSRALSRTADLLFVDPPRSLLRDGRRRGGRITPEAGGVLRLETPPHVPARALALEPILRVHRRAYERTVLRAVSSLGWEHPVLWNISPLDFSAGVAEALPSSLHVLHLTDAFWQYPRWGRQQEAALARVRETASLAIGASPAIVDELERRGFDARHLPHGVDVSLFEPVALRTVGPAAAVEGLRRPRLGFVGRLDRRLDIDVVCRLAETVGTVVLVGPSVLSASETTRLREAGCVLAGEVEYSDVPSWLAGIDVALLPYRAVPSVVASRPLKLLEYLAAGLPTVATAIPAARELGPWLETASTPEEFAATVSRIWDRKAELVDGEEARRRRVEVARPQSWERRAEELSEMIEATERRRRAER